MQRAFETPYAALVALLITSGAYVAPSLTTALRTNPDPPADTTVISALPLEKMDVLPPEEIDTETLWLARAIYSETKRPDEQKLVAWVVRNRVETNYRGVNSYRETVLDPYQFSAFNSSNPKRGYYLSLTPYSEVAGWERTLRIAHRVRHLPDAARPFPIKTRHFFSERSMPDGRTPDWALRRKLVSLDEYQIDAVRLRFYSGIS